MARKIGFTTRLRSAARTLIGRGGNDDIGIISTTGQEPPRRDTASLLASYSTSPWVRAVDGQIATACASIPWIAYTRMSPDGKPIKDGRLAWLPHAHRKEEIARLEERGEIKRWDTHPAMRLLDGGNTLLVGLTLRELTTLYLDLVGEAFWIIQRKRIGSKIIPATAWPIPPHWLTPPSQDEPYYKISYGGAFDNIPPSEVIRFHHPDPYNPYARGSGTCMALTDQIEISEYSDATVKAWFYNSARPDILISGDGMNREQTRQLEQKWLEKSQGFFKKYVPFFLGRDVKVHELSQTFENMQLTDLQKWQRDTIQQTHCMPPELMGNITNSNRCHDAETQCLTRRGWLAHDQLSMDDEIGTWDPVAERLEYHKPNAIIRNNYVGDLHYWKSRRVDVAVTPNHKMYVKHFSPAVKNWKLEESSVTAERSIMLWRAGASHSEIDGSSATTVNIPEVPYGRTGKIGGTPPDQGGYNIPVRDFGEFLGYFVSEGSLDRNDSGKRGTSTSYRVTLTQKTGTDVEAAMVRCIDRCGLGIPKLYSSVPNPNHEKPCTITQINLANKSLHAWLAQHVGYGAENKRIPDVVFSWNREGKLAFLEAYLAGDGWKCGGDGTYAAGTVSQQLADDLQRLGLELGFRTSVKKSKWTDNPNHQPTYTIVFSRKVLTYVKAADTLRTAHYEGVVWCVDVPNHLFFTRRGGKIALHGNSTIGIANEIFQKWTIIPRLELQRQTLQWRLAPMYGDDRLILDYENPMDKDKEFKLRVMSAMPNTVQFNEWRELQGLPRDPAREGEYVVSNRVEVMDIDNPPEDDPPPMAPVAPPAKKKVTKAGERIEEAIQLLRDRDAIAI